MTYVAEMQQYIKKNEAIDGYYIAIKQSLKDAGYFYNRKSFYFVVLQAVCMKKWFLQTYVGSPGRIHDARNLGNQAYKINKLSNSTRHAYFRRLYISFIAVFTDIIQRQ